MKLKKLFGGCNMTWKAVIIFAIVTGVYTGLIMLVPFLYETSFQDIGISYEFWVIFAVIVVVNCEKNWEAALKCFVFFLISQPLVYLVEIAFGSLTAEWALLYYKFWFKLTILCLPGGFIAFYAKSRNLLGSIVLGLGNSIQLSMGLIYIIQTSRDFPHHILSVLVSLSSIVVMSLCLQDKTKYRIISAAAVPVIVVGAAALYIKINGLSFI